jgi:hypothetical protein
MAVFKCPCCHKTVDSRPDGTTQVLYTYDPCYDCVNSDRLIREKNAQIRRAQAAAKAGRNDR